MAHIPQSSRLVIVANSPRGGWRLRLFAAALLLCCCAECKSGVTDKSDALQEFQQAAPPDWKKAQRLARDFDGTARVRVAEPTDLKGNTRSTSHSMKFKRNSTCGLVQREPDQQTGDRVSLELANREYWAQISRKPNSSSWLLDKIEPRKQTPESTNQVHTVIEKWTGIHFRVYGVYHIGELIHAPNFTLKSAARVSRGDRTLVKITFARPHPYDKAPFDPVQSGSLILDPESLWCISESELHLKDATGVTATYSSKNEYKATSGGFPIPIRSTARQQADSRGIPDSEYVTELDIKPRTGKEADADFTLTAFGLPEPGTFVEKRRFPLYFWLVIVGAAGLVVAGVLRLLARRRDTTAIP